MSEVLLVIEKSPHLSGSVPLSGAKNAVLVIMASLILTRGKNRLSNVPFSQDVKQMIRLLELLGAHVEHYPDDRVLIIDTEKIGSAPIGDDIMRKLRASILVMGPLLARFLEAHLGLPGGCGLGARPIDFHIEAFKKMGVQFTQADDLLEAKVSQLHAVEHILSYPSVGATENIMMAATLVQGVTRIVNAALEPEVFDLIAVLKKMGAHIEIKPASVIEITGVRTLNPIDHEIMYDRLEAGTLILAVATVGGEISLPDAPSSSMTVFLSLLQEMGHHVSLDARGGLHFKATSAPRAVSFKTMPYPGFPTDLQAPMMTALCCSRGTSVIHETVFENRLMHVPELQKMGARISHNGVVATVEGVEELYGAQVRATDIRAGAALLIAGLAAQGKTTLTETHHLMRGYDALIPKIQALGGRVEFSS